MFANPAQRLGGESEIEYRRDVVVKRVYLWMALVLLLGLTGCGKEEPEVLSQQSTQESKEDVITRTSEMTEETTQQEMEEITQMTETPTTEVASTEESTTEHKTIIPTSQDGSALTPEEAYAMIVDIFGTEDADTGDAYSYSHVNTMTVYDVEYHVFMWGQTVNDEFSKRGDLFVATDGSAIYEGTFVGDGATVNTDTNYLK